MSDKHGTGAVPYVRNSSIGIIMLAIGGFLWFQFTKDRPSEQPVLVEPNRQWLLHPREDDPVAQEMIKLKTIRKEVIEEFIGTVVNSIYPQLYDQSGLAEQQVSELVAQAIGKRFHIERKRSESEKKI